ncbi:MAG: DUF3035 domain-containing protein [Hydrotalea sp.]|nr:DUF3035 domain-containing protein [Hydrotalea sp.]
MKNLSKKNKYHDLTGQKGRRGLAVTMPTSAMLTGGLLIGSLLLAGCASKGGKISAFSLSPPDEFAVISNPPLTTPPGDALLPMPIDSGNDVASAGQGNVDPSARGLQTVFGEGSDDQNKDAQAALASQGLNDNDIALLAAANALKPDPAVRQQLGSIINARPSTDSQVNDYLASAVTRERKLTAAQQAALDGKTDPKTGKSARATMPGVISVQ